MATVWKAYSSDLVVRHAVEALRAAGEPGRDIRLLTGSRLCGRRTPRGHAVVLADVAEVAPSDAQARLDQVAQSA